MPVALAVSPDEVRLVIVSVTERSASSVPFVTLPPSYKPSLSSPSFSPPDSKVYVLVVK